MQYKDLSQLSLSVFAQLDAMIVLMDLESRFVLSNKTTAQLFGFINEEAMLGKDATQIHCSAVEFADYFMAQDKEVRETQKPFEYLDIHTYSDGDPHIFLTKKTPFYYEGQLAGTICMATELRSASLQKITGEIIKSDRSFYALPCDRSYRLTAHSKTDLSERELECLFYLVRGCSMKEIGKRLNISDRTVETYLDRIKLKNGLNNKSDLIDYALMKGLINYIPPKVLGADFSVRVG